MTTTHFAIALSLAALLLQAPPPPPAGETVQWPASGIVPPGTPGVTSPRLLKEVKPRYPREAMAAGIEGVVVLEVIVEPDGSVGPARVTRSLDTVYGLDEEALRAIKEWRFVPARRDGTPVRTAINIELSFSLRGRLELTPSLGWPGAFSVSSDTRVPRLPGWSEEAVTVDGVEIEVAYPPGWSLRTKGQGKALLSLEADDGQGHRSVQIGQPVPTPLRLAAPLPPARLKAFLEGMAQAPVTEVGDLKVLQSGQVKAGDRLWLWLETAGPIPEPAGAPPELAAHMRLAHDGLRMWTFTTTAGGHFVSVTCTMMHAANTTDAAKQEEIRRVGPEFGAMLKRLNIRER